ncbi:lytic murein transglycosylase [Candidatus Azambacteria bacterium]|nr:lytic murein transglycosylase [Candidatus Azambacteria bacterium]
MNKIKIIKIFILILFLLVITKTLNAQNKEELRDQVKNLEKQVTIYEEVIENTKDQAKTLNNELKILKQGVKKKELEIKRTTLKIKEFNLEIKEKEASIKGSSIKIEEIKNILISYLRDLYKLRGTDLTMIVLNSAQISDFFDEVKGLENINSKAANVLGKYKILKIKLEDEKGNLEDDRSDSLDLNSLLEIERKNLKEENRQKDSLLKLTQGQEKKFQVILKNKKKDLVTLKSELFYLEATGISAADALRYAELAAERAGIRTAYLLAILEVETGRQFKDRVLSVGTNLGKGHWKTDMYDCFVRVGKREYAEKQKAAFLDITSRLNYDPDKMPVSRAPKYGCGGAIGPAQFLPSTWRLLESRVSSLTGKNPADPWNIENSFTGAALFLADRGANKKIVEAERSAAKAYLSGSSSCQKYICNLYSNNVVSLTAIIDRNI